MEDFIGRFFQDLIPSILVRLGAFFRWVFLRKNIPIKKFLNKIGMEELNC